MTTDLGLVLDLLLAGSGIAVAGSALFHPRILGGVVLFIVFGVLLALMWLRLGAPDVALTEAAVGAGMTGVLLVATLARMGRQSSVPARGERQAQEPVRAGENRD